MNSCITAEQLKRNNNLTAVMVSAYGDYDCGHFSFSGESDIMYTESGKRTKRRRKQ